MYDFMSSFNLIVLFGLLCRNVSPCVLRKNRSKTHHLSGSICECASTQYMDLDRYLDVDQYMDLDQYMVLDHDLNLDQYLGVDRYMDLNKYMDLDHL